MHIERVEQMESCMKCVKNAIEQLSEALDRYVVVLDDIVKLADYTKVKNGNRISLMMKMDCSQMSLSVACCRKMEYGMCFLKRKH